MFMSENIVKLSYQDKQIWLVKTAHVSKNSIEDVRMSFEEFKPDTICVEIDSQRYERLKNPEKWRETDIVKVIKDKQVFYLLVTVILSSFQKRVANSMNSTSGGEMMEGIKLAEDNNLELVLADRPVKTTFSRIWYKLTAKEKFNLLTGLINSIFEDEDISEEDLVNLKQADVLQAALLDIGKHFPTVKEVLVDERDKYLCQKIKSAKGKKILAIVGAAHAKGIEENLNNQIDINELDKIEKRKGITTYIKYLIPIIILSLIIYTIIKNRDLGIKQILSWALWHGGLSALGVICALGHPLSILTAFIMAPLTSLNPLLASGWFAGLMEAYIRKPKVKDFENIANDTSNIKGFWKNGVTRILLVVIFANLFSSLGTFISGIDIVRRFIEIFN